MINLRLKAINFSLQSRKSGPVWFISFPAISTAALTPPRQPSFALTPPLHPSIALTPTPPLHYLKPYPLHPRWDVSPWSMILGRQSCGTIARLHPHPHPHSQHFDRIPCNTPECKEAKLVTELMVFPENTQNNITARTWTQSFRTESVH